MTIPKKWQHFEKIVAAIHRAEARGALITWNDTIKGRQFDVTVRFRHGFYSYLTVIECRDEARRIEVGDVDAFVTKSADVLANKAVMVSAAGFQKGCFEVAQRHGVSLFTLEEVATVPDDRLSDELILALNIYDVELVTPYALIRSLARDRRPENYLVHNVVVRNADKSDPLGVVITWTIQQYLRPITTEESVLTVKFPLGAVASFPDEEDVLPVIEMRFRARLVSARTFKGPAFDPVAFARIQYTYQDAISGEAKSYIREDLEVDYGTQFVVDRFYTQPANGFMYYCDAIRDGLAEMYLVESYQLGMLMQSRFAQELQYSRLYVEVRDKKEIARLQKMLHKLKEA